MVHVVRFTSALFDPRTERENPINPIAGAAVLDWLAAELRPDLRVSEATPEDWGWYCDVVGPEASYLLGASATREQVPPIEWTLQIHKKRTLRERLLRTNHLTPDDSFSGRVLALLRGTPDVDDVVIDIED